MNETDSETIPSDTAQALSVALPEADVERASLAGRGWDVIAWRIPAPGADWLLRVPRHHDAVHAIEAQTCLARVLERHDLPVPRETRLLRDQAGSTVAGLYRFESGRPARVSGRAARIRLAEDLAAFLSALHAIDPTEVAACGARQYSPWPDDYRSMLERCIGTLGPATARWVRDRAKQLARASASLPDPVLLHADLKPDHVLLDTDGWIAVVLDFESVQVSDPALDFSRLIQWWGRVFAERVMERYTGPADAHLMTRAQCYRDLEAMRTIDISRQRGWNEWLAWAHRDLQARAAAATRRARATSYVDSPRAPS